MPVTPRVTCENCTHLCDSRSESKFEKDEDAKRSERVEADIIDLINFQSYGHLSSSKSAAPGQPHTKPDIEIRLAGQSKISARLEVKYQRRAFMTVAKKLPQSGLKPWDTVAFNPKKFRRYLALYRQENIPTHLVWRVDRTCLGSRFFFQDIEVLEEILESCGETRGYRRAIGEGDKDANGFLIGDPYNFHFSINELEPFDGYLDLLLKELNVNYNQPYVAPVIDDDDYPDFLDYDFPSHRK